MAAQLRHSKPKKLAILLLVFLLCVQSIGYASHAVMASTTVQVPATEQLIAEQSTPPCHEVPASSDIDITTTANDNTHSQMPCCDEGQCADAQCMMPAGTPFTATLHDYFVAHSSDVLISYTHGSQSIKPSPPMRPPIA
jgi:hypothetical protein